MAVLLCSLILAAVALAQSSPTGDASGGRYKSEKDLRRDLFHDYDKNTRPVKKWSSAVPVGVSVLPLRIKSLDEKEQLITIQAWIKLNWTDEYLQWNLDEYDNITVLQVPPTEIWKPDIALYTALPDNGLFPVIGTNTLVCYDGTVLWVTPFTMISKCPISLRDVNTGKSIVECNLRLGSWTYSGLMLDLQLSETKVDLTNFQDVNREWKLAKVVAGQDSKFYPCCPEPYPFVDYNVTLKKRETPWTNS